MTHRDNFQPPYGPVQREPARTPRALVVGLITLLVVLCLIAACIGSQPG